MANAFKSKNGFKILYTQISWGTLWTHRAEDRMVRRGKDAAKGATVIFWRLAGGEEEELLALRVLLFVLVAIFAKTTVRRGHFVAVAPENIWKNMDNEWTTNRR